MLCTKRPEDCGAFVDNLDPTSCPQAVPRLVRVQTASRVVPCTRTRNHELAKAVVIDRHLARKRTQQFFPILPNFSIGFAQFSDESATMKNRGVVAPAKTVTNLRQ